MLKFITILLFSLHCMASAYSIIENSELWPYRISMSEAYEIDSISLAPQSIGVLVRAEIADSGETQLVVDFGRNGRCHVPARLTDIKVRMNQIESGVMDKSLPNYVQMLANKFALLLPEHNYKLRLEEFEDYQGFVFIYASTFKGTLELLNKVGQMADYEKYIILVLPESELEGERLRRAVREHPIPAGVIFPHLVVPYKLTLAHEIGASEALFVTDMDGLILRSIQIGSSK